MNIFRFSFEESEYIVNEDFVKRYQEPSAIKRFFLMFLLSLLLYCLLIMIPLLAKISTVGTMDFTVENIVFLFVSVPSLIFTALFYISYVIMSLKNHRRNFVKKFFTFFYVAIAFTIMDLIFEIVVLLQLFEGSFILPILSLSLFVVTIYYMQTRLYRGLKQSVEEQKEFNTLAYVLSEKVGMILLTLGSGGIPALLAIINIKTGGNLNRGIDAVLEPFLPTVMYLVVYLLLIESFKGYYVIKYYEQYRVKYGYSIEEWYGKNSKEHKQEQLENKAS